MESKNFTLEKEEAALIFKPNNEIELLLPRVEEDDTIEMEQHEHMFVAIATASLIDHPVMVKLIERKIGEMLGVETGSEDVVQCCGAKDPGDGSGCACSDPHGG